MIAPLSVFSRAGRNALDARKGPWVRGHWLSDAESEGNTYHSVDSEVMQQVLCRLLPGRLVVPEMVNTYQSQRQSSKPSGELIHTCTIYQDIQRVVTKVLGSRLDRLLIGDIDLESFDSGFLQLRLVLAPDGYYGKSKKHTAAVTDSSSRVSGL